MDKLKMHTPDRTDENFRRLAALFPNAVTETVNANGEVVRAIDADVLRQEISAEVVEGPQERYQFTWPDKKKSVVLANQPIAKTLRLVRERSVGRDGTPGSIDTENIYIEGDNLDALKLLQETYLGKVKMIYIDPPYNTGSDAFIYDDAFAESAEEFAEESGQYDEDGNLLFDMRVNGESNGRFHTDWLNMMYPRLRIAKDLLTDDGVIFISIDENEADKMKHICDEIFGRQNYRNQLLVRRRIKSLNVQFADNGLNSFNVGYEYVLVYSKSPAFLFNPLRMKKEDKPEKGTWNVFWSNADRPTMRYEVLGFTPTTGQWRWQKELADEAVENYRRYEAEFADKMTLEDYWRKNGSKMRFIRRIPNGTGKNGGVQCWIAPSDTSLRTSNWTDIEVTQIAKDYDLPFENPKNVNLIKTIVSSVIGDDFTVLDFFSGSGTTADAVFRLNAEDGGHRKCIMVQIPQAMAFDSAANKAGFSTICDIGEERIRRAGKKIREGWLTKIDVDKASPMVPIPVDGGKIAYQYQIAVTPGKERDELTDLDIGFRVFRVDSTNMEDVYYRPQDYRQEQMELFTSNIKPDRTPEDLLFQVMLDLGILLSSKIEETEIAGKRVFSVADGYLIACFDSDVTEETVKAIAKRQPFYAVFRDSGMASDSVMTNFEQIFETYSPKTQRKVL